MNSKREKCLFKLFQMYVRTFPPIGRNGIVSSIKRVILAAPIWLLCGWKTYIVEKELKRFIEMVDKND